MKALTVLITICVLTRLVAADVLITGTVSDSITGAPIFGATVVVTPPTCSTLTNSLGKYSLTIATTQANARLILPKTEVRILYNPAGNVFSWNGMDNFSIEVRNMKGEVIKGGKLPLGQYFAVWHFSGLSGTFKFLNISKQGQAFVFNIPRANDYLAKVSAASYVLNFSKDGYTPLNLNVSGNQNGLYVKLLPVLSNTTGIFKIDSTGQVNGRGIITDN